MITAQPTYSFAKTVKNNFTLLMQAKDLNHVFQVTTRQQQREDQEDHDLIVQQEKQAKDNYPYRYYR